MIRETVNALLACLVSFVLCAVAYPVLVWGISKSIFPREAEGSLIVRDGKVIGSSLVAQPFVSEKYFQPRPSAVDYKADATGGSNLGTKNPDLRKKIAERSEALKATAASPVPADLVTASGAGLDPDISVESAHYQIARVAAARNVSPDRLRALIDRQVNHSGAVIGAPARVNVLELNLALDEELPVGAPSSNHEAPATTTSTKVEPAPAAAASAPAAVQAEAPSPVVEAQLVEIRERIAAVSEQVEQLQSQIKALPTPTTAGDLKKLEERLGTLAENYAKVTPLTESVGPLGDRLKSTDGTMEALRKDLAEVRNALQGHAERLSSLTTTASSSAPSAASPTEEKSVDRDGEKAHETIDLRPGLALFHKGQYAEALKIFLAITEAHGDDARAWYLAALSKGLASSDWEGDTSKYLNEGIDREKADSPSTSEINASLSSLTKATGSEWLSYYRQRATKP